MTLERKSARNGDDALNTLIESRKATRCFRNNYNRWKAAYPDQWVAVSKDGLVAHDKNLDGVIAGFKERGYTNTQVIVKLLDTKPRGLLL